MRFSEGNKRFRRLSCTLVSLIVSMVPPAVTWAGGDWEWANPLPQGHNLFAADVGNGVVAAVGREGSIVASKDRVTWQVVHVNPEYWLADVAFGGGRFVAVGGAWDPNSWEGAPGLGVVLSSEDGFHWTERHRTEPLTLEAVQWNGSAFVAVGMGGISVTSSDGVSWSEHELESPMWHLRDLAWTGTEFIAVGLENYFQGGDSVFLSPDGVTWQQQPFGPGFELYAVASDGVRHVAVGGSWIAISMDGLTWDEVPWEGTVSFTDLVFANNTFLAVGMGGRLATSNDGNTWSPHDQISEFDIFGVAWIGGEFLVVGEHGFMADSVTGNVWSPISSKPLDLSYAVDFTEFVKGDRVWVGVSDSGVIITSRNGFDWTIRQSPVLRSLYSVRWSGTSFWVAGRNVILRSTDGVHWVPMLFDSDVALFDIAWNGSLYVAVGWNSFSTDRRALVVSSADGLDWDYQWLEQRGPLYAVEWTGEQFVTAGAYGILFTSVNGINWQHQEMDQAFTVRDMAWNGDRLVAVGYDGRILTSQDGTTWEDNSPPDAAEGWFGDVTWTGTQFAAVGNSLGDVVFTSPDGDTWSSESTGTALRNGSVGGDERQIFAFGSGGRFVRRTVAPLLPRRPTKRVSPGVSNGKRERSSVKAPAWP